MDAIRIENVTKNFGTHCAVDQLSWSVAQGGIFGFIGPNGSGKTTTLRMVMNLIYPDKGSIEVLGNRDSRAARDQVSYLPEERGLYKKMNVRQVLRYYGELKGARRSELRPSIEDWLKRLDLLAWADKKVEDLSKGMAQKVQFIAAVASKPRLLILDEPFSGLDPVNADELKKAVLQICSQGTTVVFSTHDMGVAEALCDRIGMIYQGRKVLDGTLDEFQRQYPENVVRVRTDKDLKFLKRLAGVGSAKNEGQFQVLRLKSDPQLFLKRLAGRAKIRYFEIKKPSLQDIFMGIVKAGAGSHVPL